MNIARLIVALVAALLFVSCGGSDTGESSSSMTSIANSTLEHNGKKTVLAAGESVSLLDQTATGFFYPTGSASYSTGAWWLAKDPDYFSGEYHLGVDMLRSYGQDVYAVADGTVKRVSPSAGGWGDGNCGLAIEHKTDDGQPFTAIYGHLLCSSVVAEKRSVYAGQPIGKIGDWSEGDHLHFGIHPGPYSSIAQTHWGRQVIPDNWSNPCTEKCLNTMTDPVAFIESHRAYNPSAEIQTRCQGNICWAPTTNACENANTRYRLLSPPYAEPVGAEACNELRQNLEYIAAGPNPQERVPEDSV